MLSPSYPPAVDPRVQAALETELSAVLNTLELRPLVQDPPQALLARFAQHYGRLCALPRRARRALERQWKRSLAAIALLMALGQGPALAATIPVAAGTPPAINNDGRCSLIEAIVNANNDAATHWDCVAGSGADTLVLPAGSVQTLTAVHHTTYDDATGLPVITSKITIQGHNSTITRQASAPDFRILAVGRTGDLTLNKTTVSGGHLSEHSSRGAGMYNSGTLTLTHSTVSGNSTYGSGGGVFNSSGTVTLTHSTVSDNRAVYGGGMFNSGGTVTLTHSTVSNNYGGDGTGFGMGGGLFNSGGTLTLTNSIVSDNWAGPHYGGLQV